MTAVFHEFVISHFCEKARWALSHLRVPFERRIWVPGTQARAIQRIAPHRTVPVLVDGGSVVQGSSAILDHAIAQVGATPFQPRDAAAAKAEEAWMDRDLGETIRCLAYTDLIHEPKTLVALWSQGGPWWSAPFLRLGFPMVRKALRKMYVDKPRLQDSQARLEAALEALDTRYATADYLVDGRFTRLDLTAAALLAPLARPMAHPVEWVGERPPIMAALHARFGDGPTLTRVRALYQAHRVHAPGGAP